MGGSAPTRTAPTVVMSRPTAPRLYQTFIPGQDYQKLADFGTRLDKQIASLQEDRFRTVGTPAELGERSRARELRENAAYLASLPGQMKDPGFMGVQKDASGALTGQQLSQPFQGGTFNEAIGASKTGLDAAKIAFQKAQAVKGEKAKSQVDPTAFDPSWAPDDTEEFAKLYEMKDRGQLKKA